MEVGGNVWWCANSYNKVACILHGSDGRISWLQAPRGSHAILSCDMKFSELQQISVFR